MALQAITKQVGSWAFRFLNRDENYNSANNYVRVVVQAPTEVIPVSENDEEIEECNEDENKESTEGDEDNSENEKENEGEKENESEILERYRQEVEVENLKSKVEVEEVAAEPEAIEIKLEPVKEEYTREIEMSNPVVPVPRQRVKGPKFPQYQKLSERLETFFNNDWETKYNEIDFEHLANAGLFYEGVDDEVRCFHCATQIKSWKERHDPWLRHVMASGDCQFVADNEAIIERKKTKAYKKRGEKVKKKITWKEDVIDNEQEDEAEIKEEKIEVKKESKNIEAADRENREMSEIKEETEEITPLLPPLPTSSNEGGKKKKELLEPDLIPRDEIERGRRIGEGGYGEIFKGFWIGTQCAIKTIKIPAFCLTDKDMLVKEAKMLSSLRHPNIVPCFGISYEGDDLWMIMELINGKDLYELMSDEHPKLESDEAKITLCLQICDAIRYMHDDKVFIHNDIKPENILVQFQNDTPRAYLSDFGIARYLGDIDYIDYLSKYTNKLVGTTQYMAPELLEKKEGKGYRRPSFASDIWSLGVLIAEIFLQDGLFDDMERYGYRQTGELPSDFEDLPDFVKDILRRCLDLKSYKRPKAKELTLFFKDCLNKLEE